MNKFLKYLLDNLNYYCTEDGYGSLELPTWGYPPYRLDELKKTKERIEKQEICDISEIDNILDIVLGLDIASWEPELIGVSRPTRSDSKYKWILNSKERIKKIFGVLQSVYPALTFNHFLYDEKYIEITNFLYSIDVDIYGKFSDERFNTFLEYVKIIGVKLKGLQNFESETFVDFYKKIIQSFLAYSGNSFPLTGGNIINSMPGIALASGIPNCSFTYYDGFISSDSDVEVDRDTFFDLASVTKEIVLLTIFDLIRKGEFSIDSTLDEIYIKYSNGESLTNENLRNITLRELLNFKYNFITSERINSNDSEKVRDLLLGVKVELSESEKAYNDISYMLLGLIIPDIQDRINRFLNENNISEDIIFYQNIDDRIITGGTSEQIECKIPNDPKCGVANFSLHAGYFANLTGMNNILKLAMNLSKEEQEILFGRDPEGQKIKEDIYKYCIEAKRVFTFIKTRKGLSNSEVPPLLSDDSIGVAGFTGTWGCADLSTGLYSSILTNPISGSGKDKDYVYTLDPLKMLLSECSIISYIFKKILNIQGIDCDISVEFNHDIDFNRKINSIINSDNEEYITRLFNYIKMVRDEISELYDCNNNELYNKVISTIVLDMYDEVNEIYNSLNSVSKVKKL